jgi:hypothetical protein
MSPKRELRRNSTTRSRNSAFVFIEIWNSTDARTTGPGALMPAMVGSFPATVFEISPKPFAYNQLRQLLVR